MRAGLQGFPTVHWDGHADQATFLLTPHKDVHLEELPLERDIAHGDRADCAVQRGPKPTTALVPLELDLRMTRKRLEIPIRPAVEPLGENVGDLNSLIVRGELDQGGHRV